MTGTNASFNDWQNDVGRVVVHENVDGTVRVELVHGSVVMDSRVGPVSQKSVFVKELIAESEERGVNVELETTHKPLGKRSRLEEL